MGDRLATLDMGRKVRGGPMPLLRGSWVPLPHLTQCGLGWGLPPYQVASWSIQPLGHSTPTLQTGQTDNGPVAEGKPFYKRSPKNHANWFVHSEQVDSQTQWPRFWPTLQPTRERTLRLQCSILLRKSHEYHNTALL